MAWPSTVKVDNAWGADILPANTGGPKQDTAKVYAGIAGGGTGGLDLIRSDSKGYFIAAAAQSFTYDSDGNMTGDGVWNYTYNAENQLVSMTTTTAAVSGGMHNRLLEFKYDYLGRRVQKRSVDFTATTDVTQRYVFDGWNPIAETDTVGTLQRVFTWGLDLAGSLSASGGVGALLQITDLVAGKTLCPAYDGNGNITGLINADSGTTEAAYEYDPSGNLLRSEGTYAKSNPFRFSTKWQDDESGLVYYGLRYFCPTLGRFINRDPISEKGGLNLYGFCGNDGVNRVDRLGMVFVLPDFPVTSTAIQTGNPVIITAAVVIDVIASFGSSIGKFFSHLFGGGGHSGLPDHRIVHSRVGGQGRGFNPDPWNTGRFTYQGDGVWVENTGQDAGWYSSTVQLDPVKVTAARIPAWQAAVNEFVVSAAKAAVIGVGSGIAIGALVAAVPAALPVVVGLGGAALIHSTYQWASGGFPITPSGAGEFVGGLAGGGYGAKLGGTFVKAAASALSTASTAAETTAARTLTETQLEFPFARGAAVQTPGVTVEGETFVRVGARPWNLKFGATPGGAQPGTYAFPQATFETIGENPASLKNFGDLPGAAPQYFRTLSPPAGTLIQRGIVPGGEFGGVGGVPEVIFPEGF